ncbi:MAG: site-specific DNA-methyltransferase [Myxococcales bacterium]|nr:MAG: site-specific DNA-methyltransferase [Myxococcales bacterium]
MDIVEALGGLSGAVYLADNLEILSKIPDGSIDLVYIDPPFNTGRKQQREALVTRRDDAEGDRVGFGGKRYRTEKVSSGSYKDSFNDYAAFLKPRLQEAYRVLKPTGSLYLHLDYREAHYAKIWLDEIFSRACFINEIIWAYDYGGRPKNKWPSKHDTILFYAKDTERYFFDSEEVERIPYMAPGLVSKEKAARGKLPTDVWWHTIVSPTGKEKLGYPTQKPIGVLKRIVAASCPKEGVVLDFFAGSGSTGAAALSLRRRFILVDILPEAFKLMQRRFGDRQDLAYYPKQDA